MLIVHAAQELVYSCVNRASCDAIPQQNHLSHQRPVLPFALSKSGHALSSDSVLSPRSQPAFEHVMGEQLSLHSEPKTTRELHVHAS